MASAILIDFEAHRPQPSFAWNNNAANGWAPLASVRSIAKDKDSRPAGSVSLTDSAHGKCLKGVFVGLALECAVGMGLFGVWQLFHFIR